jgi:hypothetical protein
MSGDLHRWVRALQARMWRSGRSAPDAVPLPMPFVVGVARSGTTLLRLMLDAHPDLAIPHETHFIPAAIALEDSGPASREAFHELLTTYPTWKDLATPAPALWQALVDVEPFSVAEGLRSFYRLYARRRGKRRLGDKTPPYCLRLAAIRRILPEARAVHIVRDGRDVALSLRPLWFAPGKDMASLARQWSSQIAEARRQGEIAGGYLEARFESLIANPEGELQRICRHVELPFHRGMLQYHRRARSRLEEVENRYAPDGTLIISKEERLHLHRFTSGPPEPQRTERWRREMTNDERRAYERVAGPLLEELGYSTR